jgi:colanic acid biosynthesis glycosyl transferase WcaI
MKILIVSQYFTPEFAIIPSVLARNLTANGHQVSVITTFPNYPEGKVYSGYKNRWRFFEQIEGATVLRVPMFINRSQNAVLRILSYLSFSISAAFRFSFAKRADVVYVYATQMTPALAANIWFRFRRTPYVLHIQDLWPESITGSGLVKSRKINSLIAFFINLWLKGIYARSHAVIAIAPEMSIMLKNRGIPAPKISTIFNWADETDISTQSYKLSEFSHLKEQFRHHTKFVYSGNIGEMQGLDSIIDAFASLSRDELSQSHLFIVGSGNQELNLIKQTRDLQLTNVSFLGRVLPQEMAEIYDLSDFQIISLKDLPVFKGTIPSKLQGSLSYGIPVVTAIDGDVHRLVSQHNLGFCAKPENQNSIAAAMKSAIICSPADRKILSENASSFYRSHMSAAIGTKQIEQILISSVRNKTSKGEGKNV